MKKLEKFGTAPVFFTAISTILGAVMFLRFGFDLDSVGFIGAIAIILIGHAVTILATIPHCKSYFFTGHQFPEEQSLR